MFSPEMLMPTGPPPQSVLDQKWMWSLLLFMLGITFTLRLVGLDIAGALLTGCLLCFGIIMTRDGMQDMAKYALVFAVLCALNFFFDILPLITDLGGRTIRFTEPVASTMASHGVTQTIYTTTEKTTPFFDASQGVLYNIQSVAMLLSPLCMVLGVYLGISANNEIQRHAPPLFEEDFAWNQAAGGPPSEDQGGGAPRPQRAAGGAPRSSTSGREAFEHFSGQGHTLS
mmetsp:Transcript_37647/g.101880  ORF Transcript_37647/g.101880 Transcript_37647/m.101880 type:complete len:228 (-) Transcript_37647:77-760(-)